jgi:hypothetical protein
MDHRRGQRWQTKLAIRIAVDQAATLRYAWLLDLSYHGARLRLRGRGSKPDKTITVWLPDMYEPIRALVVNSDGDTLGLLWIEHSTRVEHLLTGVIQQLPKPRNDRRIADGTQVYAPIITVNFGLPRALPSVMAPNKQTRA